MEKNNIIYHSKDSIHIPNLGILDLNQFCWINGKQYRYNGTNNKDEYVFNSLEDELHLTKKQAEKQIKGIINYNKK